MLAITKYVIRPIDEHEGLIEYRYNKMGTSRAQALFAPESRRVNGMPQVGSIPGYPIRRVKHG
jgi:hypothetical protein